MRAVYSLVDLPLTLEKYRDRAVAVIGDGPSKLQYIFNRRHVLTFAINRAAIDYPADFAVSVAVHLDAMLGILPPWTPMVYCSNDDMIDLHIESGGVWTATLFMRWLMRWVDPAQVVYMQGFDFSEAIKQRGGCDHGYEQQAPQFRMIQQENPEKQLYKVSDNAALEFIQTVVPNRLHIL